MIRLLIPAFDEVGPLEALLLCLPQAVHGHEVLPLVVSDGSSDGTVELANRSGVPVLDLQPNRGKGAALRAGLEAIKQPACDVVVFMDADGQHDPGDLERLTAPLFRDGADLAVGSRYVRDETRGNTPLNRYLVRSATVSLLGRILKTRFTDPYCGFRAFTAEALDRVQFCGDRYEGELEVLFDACRLELDIVEIPIERVYGPGTSKMSADGGRLIGRLRVVRQYAKTIYRKTRQLRSESAQEPIRQ